MRLLLPTTVLILGLIHSGAYAISNKGSSLGKPSRLLHLTYTTTVPASTEKTHLFLPVAKNDAHQEILDRSIEAPFQGELRTEAKYQNHFWYGVVPSSSKSTTVTVQYTLRRQTQTADLQKAQNQDYQKDERDGLHKFLQPNKRVPIESPILEALASQVPTGKDPLTTARNIYDFVIETMEYKKVGTGWGNGDTHWACTKKYGNCTDFHALVTSLARRQGIPARFEIGFPIPLDTKKGAIKGYHCWLQLYLPNIGWTPIDASEAKKHPEMQDTLFGNHPADRIKFTTGRDLQLGSEHQAAPLNYFVFPHAEQNGKVVDVETTVDFKELESVAQQERPAK